MELRRLREQLEALPPGDAGWEGLNEAEAAELRAQLEAHPELAAQAEQIAAWDRAIGGAFDDVPVPAGLAQRLKENVGREMGGEASPAPEKVVVAPRRLSRRAVLQTLLAAAAALLVAGGVGAYLLWPQPLTVAELDRDARDLHSQWDTIAWRDDVSAMPRERFSADVRNHVQRWALVRLPRGEAVLFDLMGAGARRATLLSIYAGSASGDLPSSPPLRPQSSTEGLCVGVWQRGTNVFVLSVEGSEQRYMAFLRSHGSGLAHVDR